VEDYRKYFRNRKFSYMIKIVFILNH